MTNDDIEFCKLSLIVLAIAILMITLLIGNIILNPTAIAVSNVLVFGTLTYMIIMLFWTSITT